MTLNWFLLSHVQMQKDLNDILNLSMIKYSGFRDIEEALTVPCDVLVDYTKPDIAKHQVITAIHKGVNVVVGTSGLSDADYAEISTIADQHQQSVLAVGNFAIGVVLLNKFAEMAAKYIPHWEIIDYASDRKIDSPSGSTLELANRLSKVRNLLTLLRLKIPKGLNRPEAQISMDAGTFGKVTWICSFSGNYFWIRR